MKTRHCLRIFNNLILLFFIFSSLHFTRLAEARRVMLDVNSPSSNDDHSAQGSKKMITPSIALIVMLLVLIIAILGWIFIYCKQFPGTSFFDTPSSVEELGLDQTVINTFPTLLYSDVKKLKIGKGAIECAVCLDEFRDEGETLRLLPKCCHLYHQKCIDAWLFDHTTCPVCRANLVPNQGYLTKDELHLQDSEYMHSICEQEVIPETKKRLQRSYTIGYSVVQVSENCERFTLRLTDEARRKLFVARPKLQRTVSLAPWPRLSSSPQGYRSAGAGSSLWGAKIRGDERHSDSEFGA